jgi:hypothetical protein
MQNACGETCRNGPRVMVKRLSSNVCLAVRTSCGEEVALLWSLQLMTTGGVTLTDAFCAWDRSFTLSLSACPSEITSGRTNFLDGQQLRHIALHSTIIHD